MKIALVTGLLVGVGALVFTLSQSPITIAALSTSEATPLGAPQRGARYCQAGETLPRGTSAIRLRAFAFLGPKVSVEVRQHGRPIAHGERGSGWTGGVVTVPVGRLSTARTGVSLCFTFFTNEDETIELVGAPASESTAARARDGVLSGRLRVEYLRPSNASWWSLAPEVARRMGLGRAPSGTWVALLVLVLMASVAAACARVILRELR